MAVQNLQEGDVYFLDLTPHIGISPSTMKEAHRVAVIMNARKLLNPNHKTIICVPMTTANAQLLDQKTQSPKNYFHYLILPSRYPELDHDPIIKCEQIYTINREFFLEYRFTLDISDIREVRKRMAGIIGYR